MERVLIKRSMAKQGIIVIINGVILALLIGLFTLIKTSFIHLVIRSVLAFGIVMIGLSFFMNLVILFKKNAILEVTDRGIIDRSGFVSYGLIPWNYIKEVRRESVLNQEYISITLDSPMDFADRVSFIKRFIMGKKGMNFPKTINISLNGSRYDIDEVYQLIDNCLKEME